MSDTSSLNSSKLSGLIAAILSSALSSICWIYQDEAVKYLSPFVTSCGLYLGSGILLCAYVSLTSSVPGPRELKPHLKDFILITLIRGVFATAFYCYALTMTSGMKLMFFTKLEPYFVLFFAWLAHRQSANPKQLLLLAIHVIGAIILSTDGRINFDFDQYGDLLVILTVGLVSLTYAPAARLSSAIGPLRLNAVVNLTGGLIALPLALWTAPAPLAELPREGWYALITALLLFQVFGLTLWYVAMRSIKGWIVSALRATGPILAAPIAYFAYDQKLSGLQIVGAVLVLVTSALIAKEQKRS